MKSRFVYLIPFLFALVLPGARSLAKEKQRGFLSFDATKLYPYPSKSFSTLKKGWFTNNATAAKIDTLTLCDGQASVRVRTKAGESVRAMFHFYNRDIVGKKVRFSGKYKYRQAKDAKVAFLIVLDTYLNTVVTSDTVHACEGDSEWMGFTVESEMPRTENFYFQIVTMGDMELWVSDCQAEVDGYSLDILENSSAKVDSDTEFAEESGIQIRRVNERTLDNLELLGKVWGFLKYFHPRVTEGNYNWDFELFRVLPQIAEASDKDTRNALLSQWVDKYGEIEELADYTVRDSTQFHRFAPLQWLGDEALLGKELSAKLLRIRDAKRNPVLNYYLVPLSNKEETEFTREKPYPDISWRDQGYRLLTLYRMWNAIAYCFPYTQYTDNDWNGLLRKYLPEFLKTLSEKTLNRSVEKFVSEIDDSHGGMRFPNQPKMRGLPLSLTILDDGRYAVESTQLREIRRGAVIVAVDGTPVSRIVAENAPYLPSSNHRGLLRNASSRVFLTKDRELDVTVEYLGKEMLAVVPTQVYTMGKPIGRRRPASYALEEQNILYLDMGEISSKELNAAIRKANSYKAIIIDVRKYPKAYTQAAMEKLLYPKPTEFMWYSMNSKTYPGNFFLDIVGYMGKKENPDYYKGKVVILVSETTQSLGELTAIAYRAAPNSVIIGTQTAGANGHIGSLYLPRGIEVWYTMAGAFYPNWGMNQRCGVKIDIPVTQTAMDVAGGNDVWIEKAIEYINEKQ